jgi:hypothetical protein
VAATITCAFHDAQVHGNFVLQRSPANNVKVAVLDCYTLVDVAGVQAFLQAGFELCALGTFNPVRVARNECFAEDD